jgi:3-deoxy-manno-octulosonate cytidylyltransferase (CMP-KDO synthetase)
MSGLVVIPARYKSSRFPGKPLALLPDGKPMIWHVWQTAKVLGYPVVVATDDDRIALTVNGFGGDVMMTDANHPSGTDRVWEVASHFTDATWILNLQGDEPLIQPDHLSPLVAAMADQPADVWTLVTPMTADVADPNRVKVARTQQGRALYFSRAGIPFDRGSGEIRGQYWHHIGVYLYTRQALQTWVNAPPSPLETTEQLEQLRALELGLTLQTVAVNYHGFGIDTPEDLARIQST